jgi:hypothetical protein
VSIKDDVNYVKTELSGDEKVLESAFKLESLYKKYKMLIWGTVGAAILFFAVTTGMDALHRSKLEAANRAFLTLQQKSDDTEALNTLKENNPSLYELYIFSQAARSEDLKTLQSFAGSKNEIVADMSSYTAGVIEKKPVDSKLYKEMAYLQEAYAAIKAGNRAEAKNKLELIDERSSVFALAQLLEHSILKAK